MTELCYALDALDYFSLIDSITSQNRKAYLAIPKGNGHVKLRLIVKDGKLYEKTSGIEVLNNTALQTNKITSTD